MYKPTDKEIQDFKKQYGDIFMLTVEDEAACLLKKPDRKTLSMATSLTSKSPMKSNEVILRNCWLAGDDVIKTKDEYFLAACQQLEQLIEFKSAEIKKL